MEYCALIQAEAGKQRCQLSPKRVHAADMLKRWWKAVESDVWVMPDLTKVHLFEEEEPDSICAVCSHKCDRV